MHTTLWQEVTSDPCRLETKRPSWDWQTLLARSHVTSFLDSVITPFGQTLFLALMPTSLLGHFKMRTNVDWIFPKGNLYLQFLNTILLYKRTWMDEVAADAVDPSELWTSEFRVLTQARQHATVIDSHWATPLTLLLTYSFPSVFTEVPKKHAPDATWLEIFGLC